MSVHSARLLAELAVEFDFEIMHALAKLWERDPLRIDPNLFGKYRRIVSRGRVSGWLSDDSGVI